MQNGITFGQLYIAFKINIKWGYGDNLVWLTVLHMGIFYRICSIYPVNSMGPKWTNTSL
jgi:hypothetical protein